MSVAAGNAMENYYKNLLFYLPDVVYQIDAEGKFTYINDSIRKLGYDPAELVGGSFDVIIAEEDRQSVNLLHFSSHLASGTEISPAPKFVNERRTGARITKNLAVKLLPKDGATDTGDTVPGEVFATGMYDEVTPGMQVYSGTIGIIRFTGNEHKSLKNLQRMEQHYRVLLENSFEIIAILAHDGTILYVSNSVERNIGFNSMEVIGENIETLISEQDHPILKSVFRKLIHAGTPGRKVEFRLREKTGGWKYYETMVTSIINRDSDLTLCYVFHMNDITRRKTIELAARRREQMYKMLLRTSPDAIILVDENGDIIMTNDQAEKLTARSREDLLGTRLLDIIASEGTETAEDVRARIDQAGIVRDIPFYILKGSRKKVPVEASISAIKDGETRIGYLAVIKDITQRRKAEEERQKLEKELLTIVINRLSKREIELLSHVYAGYNWPKKKRDIGKVMNVLPSTLDQFVYRIKKKMQITDLDTIVRIASIHFKWDQQDRKNR